MNYKSQLRGWAIDRTIEMWKATGFKGAMDELFSHADNLMEYAYQASEDLDDHAKELFDMLRADPSKLDAIIGTLEHIKEDVSRTVPLGDTH